MRPTLAGTGLGVDAIKRFSVDDGETIASTFTSIFLILGLFSIATGLLLIVLIFTMLAAERRSEMGMARAVGTHRKQLMHQFISEGAGYALLAGLVGSGLGVAASVGIANAMKFLFGQYVPIEPHVEPRSVIVAYCLGVVITFASIAISSWKVSKLNVVAAIRDIPETSTYRRKFRTLIWGIVMAVGGVFLAQAGLNSDTAFSFYMGASLILQDKDGTYVCITSLPSRWRLTPGVIPSDEAIFGEEIGQKLGVQFNHVPYKGESEIIAALMGGHIDLGVTAGGIGPYVDSARARWLVLWTAEHSRRWPRVPTLRDVGVDIVSTSPFGIAGPRDMDAQAVQVLHDAFRKALNEPAMQKLLERLDQESAYLNSADYAAFARQRYESQGKLVKRLGLTANP